MTWNLWENDYECDQLLATYENEIDALLDAEELNNAVAGNEYHLGYSVTEEAVLSGPAGVLVVYSGFYYPNTTGNPEKISDLDKTAHLRHQLDESLLKIGAADILYKTSEGVSVQGTDPELVLELLTKH